MKEIQSASHRVVPEIEHLLKNAVSTNIHDLGSHTVSVTHLDLDQKVGKCYPNYISEFLRGQAESSSNDGSSYSCNNVTTTLISRLFYFGFFFQN